MRPLLHLVAVCLALAGWSGCAPSTVPARAVPGQCPADPAALVTTESGDVPVVLVSTHAGTEEPQGCEPGTETLRGLEGRTCDAALDEVCQSGPCRAGGQDFGSRLLTYKILDELAGCLGGRPSLVLTEVGRSLVDMNRDAWDPGGSRCAYDDAAVLPYWEAFHRVVEERVAEAVEQGGTHALLIDLHTYNSLAAAPPPAMMLGAGEPFGKTLPHLVVDDPGLDVFFGAGGVRGRLLASLAAVDGVRIYPEGAGASLEGLFKGRYIVHRYARQTGGAADDAGPAVDALQIEISRGLRDDADGTAAAIAGALCGALGQRLAEQGP